MPLLAQSLLYSIETGQARPESGRAWLAVNLVAQCAAVECFSEPQPTCASSRIRSTMCG